VTIHEIREVDNEATLFGIVVGENAVVDEVPSKGIRYNDDYTLGSYSLSWLGHISLDAMNGLDLAIWLAIVEMALEAVWTRHPGWFES